MPRPEQPADRLVGAPVAVIADAVRAGEASATEVVRAHLDAIAAQEPTLRAWAHLDEGLALAAAATLDAAIAAGADPGPLAGVPVGVKDIVDVAGMPTTNGADLPVAGPAATDAAVVARLRAAGAVPLGKTVTTEYALFRPGPTTNPHDASRTPGGSSSGSAAAVAAGLLPLAIGTQTAGSIVRPAAFCGTVGVKPTFGTVPRDGVTRCSASLDTIGLLGVDVASVTTGLTVIADGLVDDPGDGQARVSDPDAAAARVRVGFLRTPEWDDLEPTTRAAILDGVERAARQVDVVEVAAPDWLVGLTQAQVAVMLTEAAQELGPLVDGEPDRLSPQLHAVVRQGRAQRWAYDAGVAHTRRARERLGELFADVDAVLAPAALGEAPPAATTGDPLCCRTWTLLGVPAVAVPGLVGPAGLPLGVQVVAPLHADLAALRVADVLARAWAA